ncbi:MAG: hypothetical protein CMM08_17515 [Rhodospirillaceae bacterium]|jgi:hypothetical protein|nr:hypothetical protein [Rhodospirillaceae bacterium]MDP6623343.1 hypothetical protein [Alphaproteobacteria bacterium]|tara:strand:- start:221 stop:646 length:426 start_codon:yes stop_codon:yes gene_type:complete
MEDRCRTEVTELHVFFVDWFTAALPPTDQAFSRCKKVLAPEFAIISPRGIVTERRDLLRELWDGHGSQAGEGADFRIDIRNFICRSAASGQVIATYEEWQQTASVTTARLSTVFFRERLETANDVEWLHVHETWLAGFAGQ